MAIVKKTQEELMLMTNQDLADYLLKTLKSKATVKRQTTKKELIAKILTEQGDEVLITNKSDLLRKEIRKRARAGKDLNSGELMKFMKENHKISMSRQFIVNVRNRFLTACPELLKA